MEDDRKLEECLDYLDEIKEFMASIIGNRPSFDGMKLDDAINFIKETESQLFGKSHGIIWFINKIKGYT